MKGNYLEQTGRIVRSFNKLPKKNVSKKISEKMKDDYHHFFQDCFHLKDWIINDDELSNQIKNEVENFINTSKYLKHVADIANASKHLKLTRYIRVDEDIDFEVLDVISGDKRKEMFTVKSKSNSFGGNDLPINALKEWNQFLDRHGLGMFGFK